MEKIKENWKTILLVLVVVILLILISITVVSIAHNNKTAQTSRKYINK